MNKKLQQHPGLLKNAFSVDVYHPWDFITFSHVATTWLEDNKLSVSDITYRNILGFLCLLK